MANGSAASSNPPTGLRIVINITGMQEALRQLFGYRMTLAEWIGTAALLGAPYALIGVAWAIFQADVLATFDGAQQPVAIVGHVVFWPILMVAQLC